MNSDKFKTFGEAYKKGLLAAVEADNEKPIADRQYELLPHNVLAVATRMLAAIAERPLAVNYNGDGFRRTCRLLGIKPTRKAIFEYLEIKSQ